ncbi:hypothetical protein M885DRAFT_560602 [Pelagophyceae sp. CCMP2097]|nr:hypothetical protein M885DRAFT_560602 [Pelagophyceae sp. CCMP2097]
MLRRPAPALVAFAAGLALGAVVGGYVLAGHLLTAPAGAMHHAFGAAAQRHDPSTAARASRAEDGAAAQLLDQLDRSRTALDAAAERYRDAAGSGTTAPPPDAAAEGALAARERTVRRREADANVAQTALALRAADASTRDALALTAPPPSASAACPPCAQAPRCASSAGEELLFLGMLMHVERAAADYLSQTLKALNSEFGRARVAAGAPVGFLVIDITRGGSAAIETARRRYGNGNLFDFAVLGRKATAKCVASCRTKDAVGLPGGLPQGPGAAQQSRDVAAGMHLLLNSSRPFQFALLLEDDWLACPGALGGLVTAISRATQTYDDKIAALRISYGLNGVLVPRARLSSLAQHITSLAGKKPPDHAFTAWALGQGVLVTYRHNLFVHIGKSSSIGNSGARWNAACYEVLFDYLLADVEAYQVHKCAHDVISPCASAPRRLPHPERRAKAFACDVALQDLHVSSASDRLLGCLRKSLPPPTHAFLALSAKMDES